jgi:ferredoxin-NADP reductase
VAEGTVRLTATELLSYITAALLAQMIAGAGFAFWRHRNRPGPASVTELPEAAVTTAGAWAGWRPMRVVRRSFEDASKSQCSFYLRPVDGRALPPFQPGQYLTFSLGIQASVGRDNAAGNRTVTRCYSLSDKPDPAGYRITVKRVPPPVDRPDLPAGESSGHLHDHVQVGDELQVKPPGGHFFIDQDARIPAVFVAGGIGITPMMSMLAWCTAEQPGRQLHLYYGVRNSADHAFKQVLLDLAATHPALQLIVAYSRPGPDDLIGRDYQHEGHVDLELLRRNLPHGRHQFYVCGPGAMMQTLVPALREWGVLRDDVHFESFGPASVRSAVPAVNAQSAESAAAIEVRFSRSGRTLVWDGQDANLLDFADRHNVSVDSGCRSGSCGTCETKLVSGSVTYADKPDHDITTGHCLLCVGKPVSALVLEA